MTKRRHSINAVIIAELSEGLAIARSLDNLLKGNIGGRAHSVIYATEKLSMCVTNVTLVMLFSSRKHQYGEYRIIDRSGDQNNFSRIYLKGQNNNSRHLI